MILVNIAASAALALSKYSQSPSKRELLSYNSFPASLYVLSFARSCFPTVVMCTAALRRSKFKVISCFANARSRPMASESTTLICWDGIFELGHLIS